MSEQASEGGLTGLEYLVTMTTHVPDGTAEASVEDIRAFIAHVDVARVDDYRREAANLVGHLRPAGASLRPHPRRGRGHST